MGWDGSALQKGKLFLLQSTIMDPIELSIFSSRIEAICEEMGAVLRRAAFSPNIKDRLDYSCAVFDATGKLCAQAAHIPVHLGSMAYAIYAFRCLMPTDTPACAGSLRPITLEAPRGCMVNAMRPAAVAAGHVETSTRIVDVILGTVNGEPY